MEAWERSEEDATMGAISCLRSLAVENNIFFGRQKFKQNYCYPRSLETMKATRTVWLARPGIPMLVEIQERTGFSAKPTFIEKVCLPLSAEQFRLVSALRAHALARSPDNGLHLWVGDAVEINADLLLGQQ
jgi:hypothetical protein